MATNRLDYDRDYVAARRKQIIDHLGGKCVTCGSVEDLEVDHIDRTTKCFDPCARARYAWRNILDELAKCQLLCRTCHWAKTRAELYPDADVRKHRIALVRQRTEAATEHRRRRDEQIVALSRSGMFAKELAPMFGVSVPRVYQLRALSGLRRYRRPVTLERMKIAQSLRSEGKTFVFIAEELHISRQLASQLCKEAEAQA